MALHQSKHAKGTIMPAYPGYAGEAITARFSINVPANAALGDIFEIACVPAGCRPLDVIVDTDELDTGTDAVALDVGMMSGEWGDNDASRTCGDEFLDGSDVAQAGGVARPTKAESYRVPSASTARSIGAKIATAANAGAAGTLGITVTYATD